VVAAVGGASGAWRASRRPAATPPARDGVQPAWTLVGHLPGVLRRVHSLPILIVVMSRDGSFQLHSEDPPDQEPEMARHGGGEAARGEPKSVAFAVIRRELDEHTGVLSVEGELDLASAPSLKWALTDILAAGHDRVVVDLSLVTFIDSTALGVLVGVRKNLDPTARMAITCTHPDVLNIFELTGLDATFDIFPTFDDALAFVRGSAAAAG
jgi:anti-sigma B factor antagonist